MSYVNSLSQTLFLQNQIKTQNQQLTVLQQIISNGGRVAQDFSGFKPDVANLDLALRGELARNDAYKDTIATLATRTQAIETTLTSVDSGINYLANTITQLNNQDPTGGAVQQTAKSTLDQVVAQLNAQANGVPLFSGIALNTNSAPSFPIVASDTLAAPTTATAGSLRASIGAAPGFLTVAAAQAAVTNYFATTSNWFVPGAAGVPAAPAQIADDRSIQASVTANPGIPANNPFGLAIRDTLTHTTAIATIKASDFNDFNATTGTSATYTQWLVSEIGQIGNASTEVNHAVAINGIVRHQLGDQQTITDTSTNLLQQNLDKAENDDLATSITRLNNLQNQLQASYQVTAQLRGLSLANFLPG
jgi:flagellar hook-associated protein 3 FlgL